MTGIPKQALDGRIAIVGMTGSGKSTTAKGGVERLLADGHRVCVVDLLDAWWGLRLARDGRTPAYPVAIFGGQHGDLPLTEHAGALIGQAVAQSDGSCIVSLSELDGDAARRRFALAFFDALHKTNRAPLHLVIDEADFYAPQQPVKEGPGPLLLNRIKEIAARGRMRGFRCWPITQRPAKLHKDVLSQAETLIAMQLTATQDRKAIDAWIGDQGDRDVGSTIVASLPSLRLGQGVVWSPKIGVLETTSFPLPATYDSSRTPAHGEKVASVELKPIDLGALREKMGKVEAEAKANDPRELRAEIARLRAELAKKPAAAVDQAAIDAARQGGYRDGLAARATNERETVENMRAAGRAFGDAVAAANRGFQEALEKAARELANLPPPTKVPGIVHRQAPFVAHPAVTRALVRDTAQRIERAAVRPADGTLPKAERLILTVLAQRSPDRVPVERVAAIAGYSAGGGGFNNSLGSLRGKGLIEPGPSPLAITAAGIETLGAFEPLPTGPALMAYWRSRLGKAKSSILAALVNLGGHADKSMVAELAGYAVDGGGFNNALSSLRTLGLIEGRGHLTLHQDLR